MVKILLDFSQKILAAQKTYDGKKRSELKDSDFLFPKTRSFPIVTPADVPDAISNFGRMRLTMSYDSFLKKLYNFAKNKGQNFVDALPLASKEKLGIAEAAKRKGPKSSAQTPAKPDERKKGSSVNKPGSAGTSPDAKEKAEKTLNKKDDKELVSKSSITFSEKVTNALKNKVKEHNNKYSKKVTLGQLKKVYRRGLGAFSSSHRPGKSRAQWAMARVNMFLKMVRGGKVKKAYRKADQDIAKS
tara:strand:- start:15 stop:746 length:732 start_codon:yes stop_codon:yes gene_type:complete